MKGFAWSLIHSSDAYRKESEVEEPQPHKSGNFRTISYPQSKQRRAKKSRPRNKSALRTHRPRRISRLIGSSDSSECEEAQPKYDHSNQSTVSLNLLQNLKDVKISPLTLGPFSGQILPMHI